jgi:cytochrome c6
LKSALATGALAAIMVVAHPNAAVADTETPTIFENTCAGCHAGGGNVVRREATLQLGDLDRYGLLSPDDLYTLIYSGRGGMPGYGEGCTPKGACTFGKRLTEDQVRDLAAYVLQRAREGWQ